MQSNFKAVCANFLDQNSKDRVIFINNVYKSLSKTLDCKTVSDATSLLLLVLSWPSLTLLLKNPTQSYLFAILKENLLPICITLY